jgi:hypothetical protein
MVGRLGTHADILLTESVLGAIIESMDSMLLESNQAGILLGGRVEDDPNGRYTVITDILGNPPVGVCVASSEGGTEPSAEDLAVFKKNIDRGILMKVDVFAHQFSFYKVGDVLEDATVIFTE